MWGTVRLIHQAGFPLVRILGAVENGIDDDPLRLDLIEDSVGKSADKGTTVVEKHNREKEGFSTAWIQGSTS